LKPIPTLAAACILLAIAACSSSTTQRLPLPDQSVEVTDATRSRIYVLRPPHAYGTATPVTVWETRAEDMEIGALKSGTYLCWERKPGRTLVRAVARRATYEVEEQSDGLLAIDAEPGRAYYVTLELRRGDFKPELAVVAPEEGRAILARLAPPPVNE